MNQADSAKSGVISPTETKITTQSLAHIVATNLIFFSGDLLKFVISVWIFQHSPSVTNFSLIMVSAMLPGLVIFPLIGSALDKIPKHQLQLMAAAIFLLSLVLLATGANVNENFIFVIMAAMCLMSLSESILQLSIASILPELTAKQTLHKANSINETLRSVSLFTSPMIAAALTGVLDLEVFLYFGFALTLTALFAFLLCTPNSVTIMGLKKAKKAADTNTLRSAIGYIFNHRGLLAILLLFVFSNIAQGVFLVLMYPLILSIGSIEELGSFRAALAGGMVLGGLVLTRFSQKLFAYNPILLGIMTSVLCIGGFSLFLGYYINLILMLLCGIAMTMTNGISQTLWQLNTPGHIMGRVFAFRKLIAFSVIPMAYLATPFLVDGAQNPIISRELSILHFDPSTSAMQFVLLSTAIVSFVFVCSQLLMHRKIQASFKELPTSKDE